MGKNYGGSKRDWFYSVKYIEDDGLIVAGESDSSDIEGVNIIGNGYNDAIVIKYDENGNILWENSWGGNYRDYFKEIEIDNDGNILMIGKTESKDIEGIDYNYFADSIIVKYDKNGELMWNKNFNDENLNGYETVNITSILMLNDNSFLLTTEYYFDDDGSKNYYETNNGLITKYDKNGNKKWQKEWIGNKIDFFKKFFINENNELLAFLISNSNLDEENLEYNDWTEYCMPIKYYFNFTIENKTTKNGTSPVEQQGSQAIITPTPVQGYEVDQIIIKDKNGEVLDLEVTKLEDGTYSFALFTDVSVEVTFKAKIENPKTGILDVMTILIIGFIMSITGIFVVKNYNERYEI